MINVSVDVNTVVQCSDDDYAFNVNITKNHIYMSVNVSGFVKKSVVKAWLKYLLDTTLYPHHQRDPTQRSSGRYNAARVILDDGND